VNKDNVVVSFNIKNASQAINVDAEVCAEITFCKRICKTIEDMKLEGANKVLLDMSQAK
jgi:hypothetical protein